MNTWNVFGHDWAVELLQRHVATSNLRHAYLLTGPAGVGRRTLATRLAQALNCAKPLAPGVPCLTCRTCKQIEAGQFIDLMVVQAESEGGFIKVDQVREVTKFFSTKPYTSPYKIVIFLRFQEANANAQNALLKTLEEASDYALLLLIADSAEQLLPTIVSRCEIMRLRPLPVETTADFLVSRGIPAERSLQLAHLSDGCPGYAMRLSADDKALDIREEKLDDLRRLLSQNLRDRFSYAEKLAKDKNDFRQTLLIWLSYWRDIFLELSGTSAPLTNIGRLEEIKYLAGALSLSSVRVITVELEKALDRLKRNVNPRLLAELIVMDWPRIK